MEFWAEQSLTEPCLYCHVKSEIFAFLFVFVDNILVATSNNQCKNKLFQNRNEKYDIKASSLKTWCPIRQNKYSRKILSKFGFDTAHSVSKPIEVNVRLAPIGDGENGDTSFPYRGAVRVPVNLVTSTRPDLAFALGQPSRFIANPSSKQVGTIKGKQRQAKEVVLDGFCDSDWANDPGQRKSTTGFVFMLAAGGVAWMSKRQSIIALSTAEAEYCSGT
ncbi:Integrase catalytic core protein [Phytophthora palmivora]|uniref:Integrase catalytic core protein n=1 Tax=Phytophthora palmivora TaxID=4796 RepID=A0A2P4XIZ7_9STRA|nr:Integrase catalytic core protein [Phytophthora palmivora]